jgi:hypothetical protein
MDPVFGLGLAALSTLRALRLSPRRDDERSISSFRIQRLSDEPENPVAEYGLLSASVHDIDTDTNVAFASSTVLMRI